MQHGLRKYPQMCSELVSIEYQASSASPITMTVNLEEISETSALLLSEYRIAPGTHLDIRCQTHHLHGVVEAAEEDEVLGYFLRIRLDFDSRWSEQWFKPEHLLTLWSGVEEARSGRLHHTAA